MLLITVCGASASGKTALSANISKYLNSVGIKAHVLELDSYYICHPELPFSERTLINYDAPTSFDFPLLKSDLKALMGGSHITTKKYDYDQHLRHDTDDPIYPPQVLILEGIHTFADPDILAHSDLRVYVDTDPDECIVRRMCRDKISRGRDVDDIARQYLDSVKPMYDRYIRLYKKDADICAVGGGKNARAVDLIVCYIKEKLRS